MIVLLAVDKLLWSGDAHPRSTTDHWLHYDGVWPMVTCCQKCLTRLSQSTSEQWRLLGGAWEHRSWEGQYSSNYFRGGWHYPARRNHLLPSNCWFHGSGQCFEALTLISIRKGRSPWPSSEEPASCVWLLVSNWPSRHPYSSPYLGNEGKQNFFISAYFLCFALSHLLIL